MQGVFMKRVVEAEILDTLEPESEEARANRQDMRLLNRIMGNYRWFAKCVPEMWNGEGSIIDFGSGAGELPVYLKNRRILKATDNVTGVDLWPRPAGWPESWQWLRQDLRNLDFVEDNALLFGNHILHQFSSDFLITLGLIMKERRCTLMVCEPVRRKLHLWQIRMLWPLRLHQVSVHDAMVSVRAGFRGGELAKHLGLDEREWELRTCESWLGAYRLIARLK